MDNTAELDTLFLTFNCGRERIDTSYFAASIIKSLAGQLPPDLVVLSLQEFAPIGYSFLGGSFVAPYLDRFAKAFNQAWGSEGGQYETVLNSNLGMTAIILLAKPEIARNIRWIETGGVGVGMMEMGNKGAVGARLGYATGPSSAEEEVAMTFVAAHLAPMEEQCDRRNADWKAINENLVFGRIPQAVDARTKAIKDPSEETEPLLSSATDGGSEALNRELHTMISPSSHTFFGGDLNYRTSDIKPHPEDHHSWPEKTTPPNDEHHYTQLLERDQLTRERSAGRTLHHLTEAQVTFPPTYKYSDKAQEQARRAADAAGNKVAADVPIETDWLWAPHRVPSWCDRILYLDPPFPGTQPKIHIYTALPLQPTSDHRPVALRFSIPLKALPRTRGDAWVTSPFPIRRDWASHRASARRKEIVVGVAAYLALTWEGRGLLVFTLIAIVGAWTLFTTFLHAG